MLCQETVIHTKVLGKSCCDSGITPFQFISVLLFLRYTAVQLAGLGC